MTKMSVVSHFYYLDVKTAVIPLITLWHHMTLTLVPMVSHDQIFSVFLTYGCNGAIGNAIETLDASANRCQVTDSHVASHFSHLRITNKMVSLTYQQGPGMHT